MSCIANGAELLYCRLSGLQAKLCLAQGRRTAELAIANLHVCPHLSACWPSLYPRHPCMLSGLVPATDAGLTQPACCWRPACAGL